MTKKEKWSIEESSNLYGLDFWGKPYFSLNEEGHLQVHPKGSEGFSLDIFNAVMELRQRHIRLPLLLRFPEIISSQIERLCSCFEKAITENNYKGKYRGVFPIKVNQQSHIVQDIVKAGYNHQFGLEAGSKPELLIALAFMDNPEGLIICNGFKDRNYIEMALISQKAGRNIIVVVERQKELDIILQISKELNLKPQIGFRLKLNTQAKGLWVESSGIKSKFGLSSSQLLEAVELLSRENFLDCVQLVHFHIGSQIPSIQPIKSAIKETARFFSELCRLGCPIRYVDVGGGLGVDYDGTGATRSSINYDVQEYANDIVFDIQSVCKEKNLPHPDIISESGRFIVAQSSLLVFDVVDRNSIEKNQDVQIDSKSHSFLKDMTDIYKNIHQTSIQESFNDLIEKKKEMYELFVYGVLSLNEMAVAEKIYWNTAIQLKSLTENKPDYDDIFNTLKTQLTDIYFCNFSVFQSLPDAWALAYNFPVAPMHRLEERPQRRACLADLTCDSDGKLAQFIDYTTWNTESFLPVHKTRPGEPYLLGIFLTGAYQEILGDLHNLFGDTDAVHITLTGEEKYSVNHRVEGDSILEVLNYVEFHRKELLHKIHEGAEASVSRGTLSRQEAGLLIEKFENSLSHYTYLK